jgi:hypothetical protein
MTRGGLVADLIFVVVVVAFFALSVAYVKACERIVGPDTGTELPGDGEADEPVSVFGSAVGRPR